MKMISLLIWILVTVPVWSKTSEEPDGCFHNYNDNTCEHYINCKDSFNLFDMDTNRHNYYLCQHYSIYIAFRTSNSFLLNDISWVNIDNDLIHSLDLSGNQFKYQPIMPSMHNVIKLNMSHNILNVARLSNKLWYPQLCTIDFSYNKIIHLKLNVEENVYTNLHNLNLSHNFIDVVPEGIFNSFIYLEHLDLSYNHIMDLNSMTFDGAGSLRSLDLGYNHLVHINSSLLKLIQVEYLSIKNNSIDHILRRDFENVCNITKLDLSSNGIWYIENDVFNCMISLNDLDLSENNLDVIDNDLFIHTIHLNTLNLSGNQLNNISSKLFEGKNISEIALNRNILESLYRGMFYGLSDVVKLDISYQNLVSIEDFAFLSLNNVKILLLHNNYIENVSKNSFMCLTNVEQLDLSCNCIRNFDFDKSDLLNLRSISLKNNLISDLNKKDFYNLNQLQDIDLSNNLIINIEKVTFKKLNMLEKLSISVEFSSISSTDFIESTKVTDVDLSFSELPLVTNYSFKFIESLKKINMSHCGIKIVDYNSFSGTGNITMIDLSFNKLTQFVVNSTDLVQLDTLYLNNNNLIEISYDSFKRLRNLIYLNLSYNKLYTISGDTFKDLIHLHSLHISYYENFDYLQTLNNLKRLYISGEVSNIWSNKVSFESIKKSRLTELVISNVRLLNPNEYDIGKLKSLNNLVLSHNNISYIHKDLLSNLYRIQKVDFSYNSIKYIQPGAFKNNVHLTILNVSHNSLTNFQYGTFRGLIRLNVLDFSYNAIDNFKSETLKELEYLDVLIMDYNKITHIDYNAMTKTSISKLSFKNNLVPCKEVYKLVLLDEDKIISINEDDYEENVNGISCTSNHRY